ncbi:hypothetical protein HYFRA_00006978 [Hymenoscyphus fraxineus]|uniref:DJ-1/PfpI domain-containing protein n=1 Tax=Hymenoscyphus fraxineus TaxID=746836 RepID=A0A9N9PQI0_9HELO|nr:hypothetical protein HYFRA_00006978 [Hymenoscyphus fraxineus]
MAPQKSKHLRIGVFIPGPVQLLDLSSIDLFAMLSPTYLSACTLPTPIISLGIPSTIHYISTPSTDHVELSASACLRVSKTMLDPEVQPGMLDILLVPGPPPFQPFEEPVLDFLRRHAAVEETHVLSVCTGCCLLAQAGVLSGRRASGPRDIVGGLRERYPETSWDEGRRWVRDGNVWSSGGITNGQEMVAGYLRHHFPGPAVEVVLAMADVGEKGIHYSNGKVLDNVWWLWQILKAATFGNGRQKKNL